MAESNLQTTEHPCLRYVAGLLIVLAAAVCAGPVFLMSKTARLLHRGEIAYSHERYAQAEELANQVLSLAPDSSRALVLAGESAAKLQQSRQALAYFQRVKDDGGSQALRALYGCGERSLRLGRAREAEGYLRRVLRYDPAHRAANENLVYLLEVQGRSWEALPYLWRLFRAGGMKGDHLLMAGSTEWNFIAESSFVEKCLQEVPEDPSPQFVRAREAIKDNDLAQGEKIFRQIVAADAKHSEAQGRLGRLLVEAGRNDEFAQWMAGVPDQIAPHPELWVTRGLWAKSHAQPRAAARCFWEAVRLDPNHSMANYQFGQALRALGNVRLATIFAERSNQLSKLELLLAEYGQGVEHFEQLSRAMETMGRRWEAAGWCQAALEFRSRPAWARRSLLRLGGSLQHDPALTPAYANPAEELDLSDYPLPRFDSTAPNPPEAKLAEQLAAVRFVNDASLAGIDFRYYNGNDPAAGRAYMFEFSGGGVAVLDYDGDGWPDLYLTQGCPWPARGDQNTYQDRLYRNLGTGQFADVTEGSGLGDNRFSQGAAAGDFNNDGFPDLYVANIGPNRFYRNNGDGTFTDITASTGSAGNQWTSSCVLADLNGDSLLDIYACTYLAGPDVFERACIDQGKPVQCGPTIFKAEQDRVYLNLGNERFQDVTEICGVEAPDGKGLGVVAADFDGSGRLSVFVANDTTANFFFANQTPSRGGTLKLSEQALLCGLALDAQGHAQACMGVAAGDADGDGLIDLFVTNFYRESSTFYRQQPDRTFVDETRLANLRNTTFLKMGWGTQFLDAELDGWPDLVLVNGHINDFTAGGTPYQMLPQFFRNTGRGRFAELTGAGLGPYFSEPKLGRALARLDWNRDGREDFCATHVDAPAALLTNQTSPAGHFLSISLVGVTCDRDALGAVVQVSGGEKSWTRQLTAGDGFQACNERRLVFGLGSLDRIERVKVRWPSGDEQVFGELPCDVEVVLVQGSPLPHVWRGR